MPTGAAAINVHLGDMLAWLADYAAGHAADPAGHPLFDSCVTDPPYHLTSIVKRFGKPGSAAAIVPEGGTGAYARASKGFMGKEWDGGDIAFRPETWAKVYDVLKPGAHLIAFSGTRTYHRMACAIEDAGFEIRDQLAWCYGSGFPKSHDIYKAIDKAAGHWRGKAGQPHDGDLRRAFGQHYERTEKGDPITPEGEQWQGWGTALKPAWEPICLARKPISEKSVAANVLKWGTGAIHVDACRVNPGDAVPGGGGLKGGAESRHEGWQRNAHIESASIAAHDKGRWPSNLCHDGSAAVLAGFPETSSGSIAPHHVRTTSKTKSVFGERAAPPEETHGDFGSAARFFYSAKAGPLDRIGTAHATVKPIDLMRWLVRMVTPAGGRVIEPFAGSGKTGIACLAEGFGCTMIDIEAEHVADIERQLAHLRGEGSHSIKEHNHARIEREKAKAKPIGGLFGDAQP